MRRVNCSHLHSKQDCWQPRRFHKQYFLFKCKIPRGPDNQFCSDFTYQFFPPKKWPCGSFPTGIPRTISGPWFISIPYCMPAPCLCNVSPFVLLSFNLDPETDSNSLIIFRHGVMYLWCDRKILASSTYWLVLTSFSSPMVTPFISGPNCFC